MNALKLDSVSKSYGNFLAANEVSFEVKAGEIFGLLGPNGAGKTTLISTIVGLEVPTSGKIQVFGQSLPEHSREVKPDIGYVPQELVNTGFFSAEEVLHFQSGYYGIRKNRDRVNFLLDRLDLAPHKDKKIRQLSGGMKRRLLIAKALVHSPRLLILDEPTAGVDIELRQSLWTFVRELQNEGLSVLLTTHYLEEAEELCERIAVIHQGRLRRVGPTKELVEELTLKKVRVRTKTAMNFSANPYFISQNENSSDFQIPSKMDLGELFLELQLEMKNLENLEVREGNLEEAFVKILGEEPETSSPNGVIP